MNSKKRILCTEIQYDFSHYTVLFSPTYDPASIVIAERVVHTFKAVGRTIRESCLEEIINKRMSFDIPDYLSYFHRKGTLRSTLDLFSPSDPIVNETRNDVRNLI